MLEDKQNLLPVCLESGLIVLGRNCDIFSKVVVAESIREFGINYLVLDWYGDYISLFASVKDLDILRLGVDFIVNPFRLSNSDVETSLEYLFVAIAQSYDVPTTGMAPLIDLLSSLEDELYELNTASSKILALLKDRRNEYTSLRTSASLQAALMHVCKKLLKAQAPHVDIRDFLGKNVVISLNWEPSYKFRAFIQAVFLAGLLIASREKFLKNQAVLLSNSIWLISSKLRKSFCYVVSELVKKRVYLHLTSCLSVDVCASLLNLIGVKIDCDKEPPEAVLASDSPKPAGINWKAPCWALQQITDEEIERIFNLDLEIDLGEVDLSCAYRVLESLCEKGPVTKRYLIFALNLPKSDVVLTLARLKKLGFISEEKDPVPTIKLTFKGLKTIKNWKLTQRPPDLQNV